MDGETEERGPAIAPKTSPTRPRERRGNPSLARGKGLVVFNVGFPVEAGGAEEEVVGEAEDGGPKVLFKLVGGDRPGARNGVPAALPRGEA